MTDIRSVRMSDEERDEFLGRGGTGTISFDTPDDDPPYTRPVSYGYDAETGNFYFRFAVGPDDGVDRGLRRDAHRRGGDREKSLVNRIKRLSYLLGTSSNRFGICNIYVKRTYLTGSFFSKFCSKFIGIFCAASPKGD